jgi:hypothetical protein
MHKVLKLILFAFFCSQSIQLVAQKKYALLVGVDDYYSEPGVRHHSSLKGCVNDATSMKQLLLERFGYDEKNIFILTNEAVTKKRFVDEMFRILRLCQPGDAFIFYYSGHGVWITNTENMTDPLKKGKSEAIVMSNLYSPGWECLVRDETLKEIFNQFIDKKIIATAILDCCYSANLMMAPEPNGFNPDYDIDAQNRSLYISAIPYAPVISQPEPCKTDSTGIILSKDTDNDGVPDCMDWEPNTIYPAYVDERGVRIELYKPDADSFFVLKDLQYDSLKNYNLKDDIVMNIKSVQARPSERSHSAFLALSATNDLSKGLEIRDLSGIRHGVFTAALLHIYEISPATLKVSDLIKKIRDEMSRQDYLQGPTPNLDPARGNTNLLGISSGGFNDKIIATVTAAKKGRIVINKGANSGILRGNILTDISLPAKPSVQIIQSFPDSSVAVDKSGQIAKGHTLQVKDHYTISEPLVKVYIPSVQITVQQYSTFLKSQILPLAAKPNFVDEKEYLPDSDKTLIFWETTTKSYKNEISLRNDTEKEFFYVFLPVPDYIAEPLKARIKKNQSIQLVNDPSNADFVLYITYSKNAKGLPQYILNFHSPKILEENLPGNVVAPDYNTEPSITVTGTALANLENKLYENARRMIRRKTTAWINIYDRR